MKNICLTKSNDKLNLNLTHYTDILGLYEVDTSNSSIYKSYYSFKDKIDTFILNASKINNELLSFITEFINIHKFVIYLDINSPEIIQQTIDLQCVYLIKNQNNDNIPNSKILPEFIINDRIYNRLDNNTSKINQIVYFLDEDKNIPSSVNNILYPNTKIPIKMFNGPNINHCQHVGYIDELDRKNVLVESSIYLYSNNYYNVEASLCGCKLINIAQIEKNIQTIDDLIKYVDKNSDTKYTTYNKFIEEILL